MYIVRAFLMKIHTCMYDSMIYIDPPTVQVYLD